MVQPERRTSGANVGKADPETTGLSFKLENSFNVQFLLNRCDDWGLSGAGCGSSARPVLRSNLYVWFGLLLKSLRSVVPG
ncbi:hypothetical protein XENE109146_16260 [Xenorhabdus nematophila]